MEIPKEFKERKEGYLAFGWGDKESYLNTPTWDDFKISTAVKALFIKTPSLLHVQYIKNINYYRDIKSVSISKKQFHHLEESIFKYFSSEHKIYRGYERDDFFYSSIDSYTIFNTCNVWTGDRLRESNISVSYWTPLSTNVIDSLP